MREYETVFILQPNVAEGDQKKFEQKYEAVVAQQEGQVLVNRFMGRKTLAYPIKKQTKGIYYCLDYASDGRVVAELERQMRLDENVLRFLTTLKNPDVDIETRMLEITTEKEKPVEEKESEIVREKMDESDIEK